jgi:O-antigen ligase
MKINLKEKNNDKLYFIILLVYMMTFMYLQDNPMYTNYIKYITILYVGIYILTRFKYNIKIPYFIIIITIYFFFTFLSAFLQGLIFTNNNLTSVRIPQYILSFLVIYEVLSRCVNFKQVFYLSWIICISVSDFLILQDFINRVYHTERLFGLFAASSMTSIYSSISMIFIIDLLINNKFKWKIIKILLVICLILNTISIFAQGSKTGIIHIILVLLIYILRRREYSYRRLLIHYIGGIILCFSIYFLLIKGQSFLAERLMSSILLQDESTLKRLDLWYAGTNLFLQKPLTGWGYLNELNILPSYGLYTGLHSQVLKTLFEGGMFAFLLFYGLIIKLLLNLNAQKNSLIFEVWAGIIILTVTMSSTLERGWFWFIITYVAIVGKNKGKTKM